MATIKSHTDLKQSKVLAEILPLDSADMWWTALNWQETEYYVEVKQDGINQPQKVIPCWSLAALLDVINKDYYTTLYHDGVAWSIEVIHHDNVKDKHHTYAGTQVDVCYEMILKLHEQKLL